MVDQMILGFASVFTDWLTIILILVGVLIGFTMGSIPGLTGNMAVALLIPLTYVMAPVTGISFLIAITKSGTFGGSIPAILINTPGTPAATATAMDGYQLAKQGKALKAMKMALHATCIGDLFSNIVLVLVAAQLAEIALMFGPVERFTLIVFALTIIGMVSGKSLSKGLLSAAFGLLLAGGLGYSMRNFNIPIAPLIIGFLLGPEAELTLRHSLMLSQGSLYIFFDHPVALVFLAMTAITVIKMSLRKKGGIQY